MEDVWHDFEDTGVYLNYIGAISMTWEPQILSLDKILHWIKANGFTVNFLQCKWAIRKPIVLDIGSLQLVWNLGMKVDSILQMPKPKHLSQTYNTLGTVNGYNHM